MSGMGPPPAEKKRRRNADTFAEGAVTVPEGAAVDAPDLPGAEEYGERTREWYRTWCRSPQAALFTPTDWQRLHTLAPLVDEFWKKPTTKLMGEIRLNESLLGATHLDRLRGRIKVEATRSAVAGKAAPVANLTAARRKRLAGGGGAP